MVCEVGIGADALGLRTVAAAEERDVGFEKGREVGDAGIERDERSFR